MDESLQRRVSYELISLALLLTWRLHTGRIRSRSHQTAWLVCAGDVPKIRRGSQSTRHSHIDQSCVTAPSNSKRGDGIMDEDEETTWSNERASAENVTAHMFSRVVLPSYRWIWYKLLFIDTERKNKADDRAKKTKFRSLSRHRVGPLLCRQSVRYSL